jgi:hypothetical protein
MKIRIKREEKRMIKRQEKMSKRKKYRKSQCKSSSLNQLITAIMRSKTS